MPPAKSHFFEAGTISVKSLQCPTPFTTESTDTHISTETKEEALRACSTELVDNLHFLSALLRLFNVPEQTSPSPVLVICLSSGRK